jgi:hypothetical protein
MEISFIIFGCIRRRLKEQKEGPLARSSLRRLKLFINFVQKITSVLVEIREIMANSSLSTVQTVLFHPSSIGCWTSRVDQELRDDQIWMAKPG